MQRGGIADRSALNVDAVSVHLHGRSQRKAGPSIAGPEKHEVTAERSCRSSPMPDRRQTACFPDAATVLQEPLSIAGNGTRYPHFERFLHDGQRGFF